MNRDYMLVIPILFPVVCGLIIGLLNRFDASKNGWRINVILSAAAEAVFTFLCFRRDISYTLWSLNDRIDIVLKVDELSRFFMGLAVVLWLLVGIYACDYMKEDEHRRRFFAFYLCTEGMIAGIGFAGNILTFYMFFELMTMLTFPLVMHDATREAIMAGLKYLFYSVAGAFLTLLGIFMLTPYGILSDFKPGGALDVAAIMEHREMFLILAMCMIIGLGTKAGMFPMHSWLSAAHPEAPAPASAVLSGVITKTGVIGIIRIVYYLTGPRLLAGTWVQGTWIVLSLITVFMGSMMAYREKVLKRRLAYSTVSQVSYIMFGLAVMNSAAFTGAVLHLWAHALIKTMLFLMSGAVIHQTGHTRTDELRGIGKEMPVTIWCYTLCSLGLIGIPPFGGFISKWHLATGALVSGENPYFGIGPVILLISALLTAAYLLPISIEGFMPGRDYDYTSLTRREAAPSMYVSMIILTAGMTLIGLFPGILTDMIKLIAQAVF